jgi:ABC-2 type transport system ATP-binding protein
LLDRAGLVAQDTPMYGDFSVADMVHFGRTLNGRWDQKAVETRLRMLNIRFDRKTGRLSVSRVPGTGRL